MKDQILEITNEFNKIPKNTTTIGPCINWKILCFLVKTTSQRINITIEMAAINTAPGVNNSNALLIAVKVFSPST
jgi:hypothetical protein